ncbi:MAG TPA: flagellum-specific ATP synthase FliI, partial [Spirochaetia bacterium]|nr:flagellum-specific ATP synthase FliI [Spirochaetia bacterium]
MPMFEKYCTILEKMDPIKYTGTVQKVQGLVVESHGPQGVVGELCQILVPKGRGVVWSEIVGFKGNTVQLMPYDDLSGIEP